VFLLRKGSAQWPNSSVGKVIGQQSSIIDIRREFFSSPLRPDGSAVRPTSYPMGNKAFFLGGKGAGVWSWPLTSN